MKIAGLEIALRPLDNLNLKVISLVLALGLWNLVPDPSTPHQVRAVPVQLENIPADLALSQPFDASVDVLVRGPTVRARALVAGELSPRLDMASAHAGQNLIDIGTEDIPSPWGVTVQRIEPSRVRVDLGQKVQAMLPVEVVIEGAPAPGYEIRERIADPPRVRVVGARSRVEAVDHVVTEVVSVTGLRETVTRSVNVLTEDALVSIEGESRVQLTIRVEETPVTSQLDEVAVEVINASRRVAVNPTVIGVVLRGPPSLLGELTRDNLRAVVDVAGLAPRAEDYRLEPEIRFLPDSLAERVEIITLTPQRRIDVHVFERPPEP